MVDSCSVDLATRGNAGRGPGAGSGQQPQHSQHTYYGAGPMALSMRPRRCAGGRDRDSLPGRRGRCWPRREATGSGGPLGGPLALLEQDARARLRECALTEEGRTRIDSCVAELRSVVQQLGTGWALELFGSMATGFGTNDSDVDATCFQADAAEETEESQGAVSLLRERLAPALQAHPNFVVLEQILGARVPLLKLRFRGMLDIDLSCCNTEALQNTRLLRAYAQLDHRVRDLCILVKLWAKGSQVCGASGRHLSSYTFTLMTIYFMQVHLKLPCLHTSDFKDGQDRESKALTYTWSSRMTLAELVYRFFWFYNFDFGWCSEVVCVRLGVRYFAADDLFQLLRGRHTARIHVEDPYRLERNLHCVLGLPEEVQLRTAFAEAMHCLSMGQVPCGLQPIQASEVAEQKAEAKSSSAGAAGAVDWKSHSRPSSAAGVADPTPTADVLNCPVSPASPEKPPGAAASADCEAGEVAGHPDGAISEVSTEGGESGASEWRSPSGSFSSDDEKSRGRSQSSDDEARAPHTHTHSSGGIGDVQKQKSDGASPAAVPGTRTTATSAPQDAGPTPARDSVGADSGHWQWWQRLGSANVAKALKDSAPGQGQKCSQAGPGSGLATQGQSRLCLTVQELEHKMGDAKAGPALPEKSGTLEPTDHAFKAKATARIAAQVCRLCREHMRYQ